MAPNSTAVNPPHMLPGGSYSHALIVPPGQKLIFTAGQIGTIDAQGTVPDSYEEQVEAAIRNLGDVLAASGATPEDIIKLTYFIVDYGGFFPDATSSKSYDLSLCQLIQLSRDRCQPTLGSCQCAGQILEGSQTSYIPRWRCETCQSQTQVRD